MNSIFAQAFAWLKGLAIIHIAVTALKRLWPFLLLFIFWPEINSMLGNLFPFWNEYMSSVSGVISNGSYYLRQIPFIKPVFDWLSDFFRACGRRIATIL